MAPRKPARKAAARKPRANKKSQPADDSMPDAEVNGLNGGLGGVANGSIVEAGGAEQPTFSWL